MCDTDWFWLQFQSPKNVDTLMQIVQLFWPSEASWLINYMLKIVMKYLSSMYLQGYSGTFLFLLQTSGIATHNTVNDAHLKQAEQWFRPRYISTCLCSDAIFSFRAGGIKTPTSLMKLFGPVAQCRNSRRWFHQYLNYRSKECFLVEHCSSSLNWLPWIPGAWPHYNFHT